jgi:hypothetical protein
MRNIRIGLLALLCVLWAGAVWAFPPVPETGQVLCYSADGIQIDCAGTGQDGALQKGVKLPTPRFKDNKNGTTTDKLTGLIWLKTANCPNTQRDWQTALSDVASLNTSGKMNGNDCGDTSGRRGSHRTDWRLPNIRELFSLIDFAFVGPAISNAMGDGHCTPVDCEFSNLGSYYWSSTTNAFIPVTAWTLDIGWGNVGSGHKDDPAYVIAVRGGW